MSSSPEDQKQRQNASRKRRRNLPIPDNLVAHVLTYLDASDYISVLWAAENIFVTPLRLHLGSAKSLNLSFLLRKFPNTFKNTSRQQLAVQLLLQSVIGRSPTNRLKHVELSNLRGVTGKDWLPELSKIPLVTLDLTNCKDIEQDLLYRYFQRCPRTLRHLHLNGIPAVDRAMLIDIGLFRNIVSLSLGACSQYITARDILRLLKKLTSLKHLDLQGLNHLNDRESPESEEVFLDVLPESLESLNLSGTKPLRLVSHDVFATMNTYLTRSLENAQRVQDRLHDIAQGLVEFNNGGQNADGLLRRIVDLGNDRQPQGSIWKDEPTFRLKLKHIVLNGTGPSRSGIFRGSVATLSLGRCLKEVHLSGCEAIGDWEIQAIAVNCGETLTCFQMRGGSIGNPAIKALGKHCRVLAELDVSACFAIDDRGIMALVDNLQRQESNDTRNLPNDENGETLEQPTKRSRISKPSLTILRIAALPKLTNQAIRVIAHLKSLIVLDIHDCKLVGNFEVFETITQLPRLVDIDARNINYSTSPNNFTLPSWLRGNQNTPATLKRINNRKFKRSEPIATPKHCCIVRCQAQKLSSTTPLAPMYHCIDCGFIPEIDRGFCVECLKQCHVGHKTFLGSYARYSCDCPFATVNTLNTCQAIMPSDNSNPVANSEQIETKIMDVDYNFATARTINPL